MWPVAIVKLVPLGKTPRQTAVALAGSRIPSAPNFPGVSGIAQVDDDIELIVQRIARIEIRHAGRQVGKFAIYEPETVRPTRVRPRSIEEGQRQILQALGFLNAAKSETSSTHIPAIFCPTSVVWFATAEQVSRKAQRIAARMMPGFGDGIVLINTGFSGRVTSTTLMQFFGASCARNRRRRPSGRCWSA